MTTAEKTATIDVDVRQQTSKMTYTEINTEVDKMLDMISKKRKDGKRMKSAELAELKAKAAKWAKVALDRSARV